MTKDEIMALKCPEDYTSKQEYQFTVMQVLAMLKVDVGCATYTFF